jgi:hypothetical protein
MSSTTKGFAYRDMTYHGKAEQSRMVVNFAKALPASTTGNLFAVTGSIAVTGLVGVVSTILQASNVSPTIGVTGLNAAIAAAPAAPYNATAVGSVIQMPLTGGGALPAAVVASGAVTAACRFAVTAANITITTATTVTGNITWILSWVPLMPKGGATVTAV